MATLAQGTKLADGTVQDLVNILLTKWVCGFLDLSNMVSGDTVIVTYKIQIKSGGNKIQHWQATYSGAQANPMLPFPSMFIPYGIEVSIQQTAQGAGGYKNFDYYFEKI